MSSVAIYLNFMGNTEEAFNFYKTVFGTEFSMPPMRLGDAPPREGSPALSDKDKNAIMHVSLPITGGTVIMGTDFLEIFGQKLVEGNNVTISLQLDTEAEADQLFAGLSEGGLGPCAPCARNFGDTGVAQKTGSACAGCLM